MSTRRIKDLRGNPENPRVIDADRVEQLRASLLEYGDLSGFVFNRKTGQLVGGHQRQKAFDSGAEVVIERRYKKATRTGTVAEGFVTLAGERFNYREVQWDEMREKAANIAANKQAGDWEPDTLATWMGELNDFGMDLSLTMFSEKEVKKFLLPMTDDDPEPDTQKGSDRKVIACPNCGYLKGMTPGIKTKGKK